MSTFSKVGVFALVLTISISCKATEEPQWPTPTDAGDADTDADADADTDADADADTDADADADTDFDPVLYDNCETECVSLTEFTASEMAFTVFSIFLLKSISAINPPLACNILSTLSSATTRPK